MKITKRIFRKTKKRSSKRKKKYNKSKKTYIKGAGGVLSSLGIMSRNKTLHEASQDGDTELVEQLIENGADVNESDRHRLTPLHHACAKGKTETAITLIEMGANINALDRYNMTPLHHACVEGKTETAEALIEMGADIDAKTTHELTPLDLACGNHRTNVAKLLIDNGANPKLCIGRSKQFEKGITRYIHEKFGNSLFLNMVYEGTKHAKIVDVFTTKKFKRQKVSDADLYKALYIIVLTNNISLLEALIEGVGFEEIMKYKSPKIKQNIIFLVTDVSRPVMLKLLLEKKSEHKKSIFSITKQTDSTSRSIP